jgi:hypothetical protein
MEKVKREIGDLEKEKKRPSKDLAAIAGRSTSPLFAKDTSKSRDSRGVAPHTDSDWPADVPTRQMRNRSSG